MSKQICIRLIVFVFVCQATSGAFGVESKVDFNRDVLPILSDNCFKCHGPDEANRESGLRLDRQEGVFKELDSGSVGISPGKPDESEVYVRVSADDPDTRMPPHDSGKSLTQKEIETLKSWIEQGAEWSGHWAFISPQKVDIPQPISNWKSNHPLDRFIQRRLIKNDLSPSAPADKETLIRRVTLDLLGFPPAVEEVDAFLRDSSPDAYEKLVDRLLDSARYGEHMGRIWLDAARYADTHGLHLDNERSIWPYRKWVIDAFNANLPFDQFTVQQLAGDLLPNPSDDQLVATGFNRCNVTTSEGGSIDDEYYVRYAVDRVETTSTVWLGLTAGCAACHDHKFDPLTQQEFYQLFSYFFSLTEKAMDGNALLPPPVMKVPSKIHQIKKARLSTELQTIQDQIAADLASIDYQDPISGGNQVELKSSEQVWIEDELPAGAKPSGDGEPAWQFVSVPDHPVFSGTKSTVRTADGLSQHVFTEANPKLKIGPHDSLFAYVYLDPKNPPETVQLQFNDGSWEHRAYWGANKGHASNLKGAANFHAGKLPETGKWVRLEIPAGAVGLNAGAEINGWAFTQFKGTVHWDKGGIKRVNPLSADQLTSLSAWEQFRKIVKYPALPGDIQTILDTQINERTDEQQKSLPTYFLQNVNPETMKQFQLPIQQVASVQKQIADLDASVPSTLIMKDRDKPRQAHILERGEYTLKRDKVSSQVPAWILAPLPEAPPNRLGLAQWMVAPGHPLTSRVTVNRIWQHFFGTGLVKTSEDFGVQGERPSHPELLDWLAVDFIESGWDMKRFIKKIVTSSTYMQSSKLSAEMLEQDPENRLLARGPRFRLDAEVIRDQALAISGLLVEKMGGKSVKPYQPEGLWKPVGFGGSNTSVFKRDNGPNLYRRSMYTFWKRTSPPPSMSTFDAPDRETCQVRRARTNTPLQALVLMNDVQFFEAARGFAQRVIRHGGDDDADKLVYAFRTVTARRPHPAEFESIATVLKLYRNAFQESPESATKILTAGETPADATMDKTELSAWTMVTHLLMNLNETVTKN